MNPERDLTKYRDDHLVLLTSFKESILVRIGKGNKKEVCERFEARSPEFYVKRFDNLFHYISNSYEAEAARSALKAWRHGQRQWEYDLFNSSFAMLKGVLYEEG